MRRFDDFAKVAADRIQRLRHVFVPLGPGFPAPVGATHEMAASWREAEARRAREFNFRLIVESIPSPVAIMSPAGELEAVNRLTLDYFGKTFEELKNWGTGDAVHRDDLPRVAAVWAEAIATGRTYEVESRHRRADGVYRWFQVHGFPLRDADGRVAHWCVLQTDIEDRKQAETLLAAQKTLFEMVASGSPLPLVLDAMCRLIEDLSDCACTVRLIEPGGRRFQGGAAPSLPSSYNEALDGRPVDCDEGPCGTAAYLKIPVILRDVASDPRWRTSEWRNATLAQGLRSCWSAPILSGDQTALGVLALYRNEPGDWSRPGQDFIAPFRHIAGIAIERALGEAALKQSEVRKAAIVDAALDCIVSIDHEGRITEFNPAAERTFGHNRGDVLGKCLADVIIPPSLRERHQLGLARHVATGESRVIGERLEMTAIRADGGEFPVELAITRLNRDGRPSFTGYLRDITERKQAEEKLRRSEAFLAEAQHLSSTGSFSWRVETDEIVWSEQLYRIFEYEPGARVTFELIGARVHPEDRAMVFDMIDRGRGAVNEFEYEHRLLMPDRSVKYLHLIAYGVRDKEGRLEYIGAAQDVTQRRLSDEALAKLRTDLSHVARVTSLGVLTASIAHEVNQPLGSIIINGETALRWLARPNVDVEKVKELTRRVVADARRAADIIERVSAMATRRAPQRTPLSVDDIVEEAMVFLSHEFQSKGISVSLELSPALPKVVGDRTQIQQVIVNLAMNAVQAMAKSEGAQRILIVRTVRSDPETVCCMIEDSGPGLDPAHIPHLFDSFFTTKDTGMGMGLPISRSIIEAHNGQLRADNDSAIGGARFSFALPADGET
jgi:PAS domain S-box-containing protein